MSRHAAPSRPHQIGERLTVAAVLLIVGTPAPVAAGTGRHAAVSA